MEKQRNLSEIIQVDFRTKRIIKSHGKREKVLDISLKQLKEKGKSLKAAELDFLEEFWRTFQSTGKKV